MLSEFLLKLDELFILGKLPQIGNQHIFTYFLRCCRCRSRSHLDDLPSRQYAQLASNTLGPALRTVKNISDTPNCYHHLLGPQYYKTIVTSISPKQCCIVNVYCICSKCQMTGGMSGRRPSTLTKSCWKTGTVVVWQTWLTICHTKIWVTAPEKYQCLKKAATVLRKH